MMGTVCRNSHDERPRVDQIQTSHSLACRALLYGHVRPYALLLLLAPDVLAGFDTLFACKHC
jgi:hypothetical protein